MESIPYLFKINNELELMLSPKEESEREQAAVMKNKKRIGAGGRPASTRVASGSRQADRQGRESAR